MTSPAVTGLPRLAYRSHRKRDKAHLLLFAEDRELEQWRELKEGIEEVDISSLTPLDALNFLSALKNRIKRI